MATPKPFPQAGFLHHLELLNESAPLVVDTPLPSPLGRLLLAADGSGALTKAAAQLIQLLQARKATLQASFDTEQVADELRRYQKFAKPGQPSPHIVQLRQQQAAVRQASSLSKQSYIKAAAAFVREAGIEVPPSLALEVFITRWIEVNVPVGFVANP
ncbi:MAG: hypothetical protein ACREPQ_05595 [Rhodanobacter sp.]